MRKVIYRQYDSRWGSKPYPTKGSSFSGNGCGCCACTHIIIEQDKYKDYTPEPIRKWMVKQGFAVYNQGTTWSGITKTLEHYGYSVCHIGSSDPMSKAWKELDKGDRIGIILFSGGSGPDGTVWTAGGHYIAFTDYKVVDGKHKMYMKDSGGRKHDGWYAYEKSMRGRVFQMWIVKKIKTAEKTPEQKAEDKKETAKLLEVDGNFSVKSVKKLENTFGIEPDGYIGGQSESLKQYHTGFSEYAIKYTGGGSSVVRQMQKWLGMSLIDGQLGKKTITALQNKLGMKTKDGVWGKNTSKAVQTWLNTDPKIVIKEIPNGIDISAYQKKLSVKKFQKIKKSGIKFAIIRIGYTGSSSRKPTIDSVFINNIHNCIEAGIPVGIYYYSLATTKAKAEEEANFCIKYLKGLKIDLPVYIDIEDSKQMNSTQKELADAANRFCTVIKNAGYKAGVYASLSWFNHKIGTINKGNSIWVAQYNSKCEYKKDYDIWQYSSSGKVVGISGKVDMNYCYNKNIVA